MADGGALKAGDVQKEEKSPESHCFKLNKKDWGGEEPETDTELVSLVKLDGL